MRVLILTRLYYCNLLYYGLPDFLLQKLQPVMNFACKLIFRLSPGTPTLYFIKRLQWLSVRKRIIFETILTGHRLVDDPQMVPHYLKSLSSRNGKVTRSHYNYNFQTPTLKTTFGQGSFSFAVPHEWNLFESFRSFYSNFYTNDFSMERFFFTSDGGVCEMKKHAG